MGYDEQFFKSYEQFLDEPTVHQAHEFAIRAAGTICDFSKVVDLGAGVNEFERYAKPGNYIGLDSSGMSPRNLKIDYRDEKITKVIAALNATCFVSLFSVELTSHYIRNYQLYDSIFKECPTIQNGVVSGIYYSGRTNQNPVQEHGGLISYQTLEPPEVVQKPGYSEVRIVLPVPSRLFGQDVYEVWKVFSRRQEAA